MNCRKIIVSRADAIVLARRFDPGAMQVVQSGKEKEDLLGQPGHYPQGKAAISRMPGVAI